MDIPNGIVNLKNGNVHLEFVLHTYKQRTGPPAVLKLTYDSMFYYESGYGQPNVSTPPVFIGSGVNNYGWRAVLSPTGGTVTKQSTTMDTECSGVPPIYTQSDWFDWVYTDNSGASHRFGMLDGASGGPSEVNNSNVYCYGPTGIWEATADDSTGYKIRVTLYQNGQGPYAQVWDKYGTLVYDELSTGNPPGNTPLDTNGNYFSRTANLVQVVDQLGRTIGFPQPVYDSMTVEGTAIQTQSFSVCTNFQQDNATEFCAQPSGFPVVGTIQVPTSITLPDGRSYQFQYDTGTSPGHYGQMTRMILPNQGQVTFNYGLYHSGGPTGDLRVTTLSVNGNVWNFGYTPLSYFDPSSTTLTTTVTAPPDPAGVQNQTIYTFTPPYPNGNYTSPTISIKQYAGAAGGSPMRQTTYVLDPKESLVLQATTILDTGLVSSTAFGYVDDLVADKREYDFSNNLIRETTVTYNSFMKPTAVNVYGPGGSSSAPIAQTLYDYDTTSLTPVSATNHDDANYSTANTSRGNVTRVRQMTSSGSFVTVATNYYNTLGELVETMDAKGNPTYYDYTDRWSPNNPSCISAATYAYPTKVTLANL